MLRPRRPISEDFFGDYHPHVVVCFSAKWCGPCQQINKKLLVELTPNVKWYSVDIDINKTTLGYCGLTGIPSFVIINDGIFKDKRTGGGKIADILLWLSNNEVPVNI